MRGPEAGGAGEGRGLRWLRNRIALSNPVFARRLGENGYEHVKKNFLITHNLKRYLLLFLALSRAPS